jgi:beta-glucanase (GH16 family)
MRQVSIVLFLMLCVLWTKAQCEFLVWSDEFDGTTLNTGKWGYDIGNGCPSLCGWGNGELEYYTDREENVKLEGGNLIITALEESYEGSDFTSGKILTRGLVSFSSGRMEASIKLPQGQGLWPAFWMLPEENTYGGWPLSGEIDIMEMLGQETNTSHGTIHYGGSWPFNMYTGESYNSPVPLIDDFHIYAVEWNATSIDWYVDDVLFSSKLPSSLGNMPWRFDQDFYLILNVAVGGYWPGYPDESTSFPQTMEVDYVRVYQTLDDTFVVGRERVITNTQNERYHVPTVEGASYAWTVGGGEIVSGQGSSEIMVNWGELEGEVSCDFVLNNCNANISKSVQVINPDCEVVMHDLDSVFDCQWINFEGQIYNDPVPSPNEVNSSENCMRYVRGNDPNDQLKLGIDWMSDAAPFEEGEMLMAIDLYTNATPGQPINLYFENQQLSYASYPNGRHSVYTAVTELQYEWHTLYFPYSFSPQQTMANDLVNQFTFYFAPAEQLAYTYYLDNIRVVDADCFTGIAESFEEEVKIWPVPSNGTVNFQLPQGTTWTMFDSSGRLVRSGNAGNGIVTLNELSSGTYQVQFENIQRQVTKKIIVL